MERSGEVVLSGREVRPNVQLGYKSANVEMATNCRLTTDRILLSSSIQPTDYMISRIKMGGETGSKMVAAVHIPPFNTCNMSIVQCNMQTWLTVYSRENIPFPFLACVIWNMSYMEYVT